MYICQDVALSKKVASCRPFIGGGLERSSRMTTVPYGLSSSAGWTKMGRTSPNMQDRGNRPRVVTAAVIERDGRVLCARRKPGLVAEGLWEFPGGKLEDGEDPRRGLERELREEMGVEARIGEFLCAVPFSGPTASFELVVFRAELIGDDFRLIDHDEVLWLTPEEMDESRFSKPDRPVVRMLAGRGRGAP
jgi:8-oxo-dGTP diphosphatase